MSDLMDRINTLKTALEQKTAANDEIVNSIATTGEGAEATITMTPEHREAFQKNLAEITEIKSDIALLTDGEDAKGFLKSLSAPATDPAVFAALAAAGVERPEHKTLGQMLTESASYKAMIQSGGYTMAAPVEVGSLLQKGIRQLQTKDIFTDLPTGTPGRFGSIERDPMVPMPMRQTRVRDLFPARPTTATTIEYFRVTGFTNNAAPVAERRAANGTSAPVGDDTDVFGVKPKSNLTFVGEQASVRTIAHWEAAHRNALADEPQLQGIVDGELLYGLQLVEDNQILNGDGTGENLRGLLQTSGIQTYAEDTAPNTTENKADALRRAITKVMLAYYPAQGIVMHDTALEAIELLKDSNGQYLFAVNIQDGGAARAWRVPIVTTPAIAANTALVGAFGLGAQLYDREQGTVRIAEQHSDFFVRNAVAILAEERLALAVKRPESFCKVTFT